jgi:hypothetical protein
MKMKYVSLLIIIVFFSCMKPPINAETSYYPLEVGNEWHYYDYYSFSFGTDSLILKVDSTTIRNGVEYFVLSTYTSSYYDLIGQSYMRYDEGKYYTLKDSTEYLSLDFTIDINQSWSILGSNSINTIISKDSIIVSGKKTLEDCIVYLRVNQIDSSYSVYAKDIGLIEHVSHAIYGASIESELRLIWAKIDNEKIVLY